MAVERRNWDHAAGVIWPTLVEAASKRKTLVYSELSPLIDTNPLNVGRALGPIQDFCIDHDMPPLTAIVIGKTSRVPGDGFIAWDIDDLPRALDVVFDKDWSGIANPYAAFSAEVSKVSLAKELLASRGIGGDVYRLVKDRGIAQRIFRLALLEAYDEMCAFCDCSFTQALEGAHIIPWQVCTPEQKLDPGNGLLLCANHHRLFDKHMLSVTKDGRIEHYDPEENDGAYSPADHALTTALHGRSIRIPANAELRPDPGLLRRRRKAGGWKD